MRRCLPLFFLLSACAENQTHPLAHPAYDAAPLAPLTCVPNLDGRIDAAELQAAIGIPVAYLVSPAGTERTVDLAGSVQPDGTRVWDWSLELEDDTVARLQAAKLASAWFAASFPEGQFTAPLDAAGSLLGVYVHDDAGLWLLGMATAVEAPPEGQTLLVYDQPVAVFTFPIEVGQSWTAVGKVQNGTVRGLPYAGRDVYEVTVDAAGHMLLPDLELTQALRVRTKVTVEPAVGQSHTVRQASYVFECMGEVARATSRTDEPEDEFTKAAEVRRLGLGL